MISLPIALAEGVRKTSADNLNQLLADTISLRDMYKKHHWQVSGPTFYQLHLLFDKHAGEQTELVDQIAERIMMLGGVSVAMAFDVAETTTLPRPPKGREEAPMQISRLLEAARVDPARSPLDGQAGRGRRRRRDQRLDRERRDPHARDAGLVPGRARGRRAAGPRRQRQLERLGR